MAITAVVASAAFGAVTGVSSAAVATMGAMTIPEMRRYKYDPALATGSLAAAGTLAILIPPSVLMIVYGIWTETSIGTLFIAGIIPGILLTTAFAVLIYVQCRLKPELGPVGPRYSWRERFASLRKLLPIIITFFVVIGGIYVGAFTPTEASAIGVIGVLVVGLFMRRLTAACLKDTLIDTSVTTGMIFAVIIGGHLIGRFLVLTDVTSGISTWIGNSGLNRYVILTLFVLMYLVLGALLDVWGHAHFDPALRVSGDDEPAIRPGLVRHIRGANDRTRADHAADRHQCLRHARHRARGPADDDFPGHLPPSCSSSWPSSH